MKANKNSIFKFLFVTLFLDAYRIIIIGNRNITLWYIGALILFLYSFANFSSVIASVKKNQFAFSMAIYMTLNQALIGTDISSYAIGLCCWLFYISSYRRCKESQFVELVDFFLAGMKIMSVYGIYQIIGNLIGLPFTNLKFASIHVGGYNWGNSIVISGITLRRSNAIFREPSFFSQFLAMSILIYIQRIIADENKNYRKYKKTVAWIIIMLVAMVCSFSGTGLLMLGIGSLILLIRTKKTLIFMKKHILLVCLFMTGIFILIFVPNPLTKYFLSRTREFDYKNTQSVSGYVRMILPYQAAFDILQRYNIAMGIGIGGVRGYAVARNGFNVGSHMSPIIARTFAEEGLIGAFLLLGFFCKFFNKRNIRLSEYRAVLVGTLLMSFMHGTWSSEVFWLFLGMLNIDFIADYRANNNAVHEME